MHEGLNFSDIFDDDIPAEQKPPEMLRPMEEKNLPIQDSNLSKKLREVNLIAEVHLQDLFHATNEDALLKILESDSLKLTFVGGTTADEDINGGYPFFLSTMRQKYGNYARGFSGPYGDDIPGHYKVIIHLDGESLKNNGFKHFPVNFWGSSDRSEQEERIVSHKDEIRPLSRFIKDIHVYIQRESKSYPRSSHFIDTLYKISALAPQRNIKVYFYPPGTQQYFKSHRYEKATTDVSTILPPPTWTKDELEHEEWLKRTYEDPKYLERHRPTYLEAFLRIYNGDYSRTEIHKSDDERVLRMLRWYHYDIYPALLANIHNYRKDHPAIFREVAKILKKEGLTRFRDLITLVIKRVEERDKEQQNLEEHERLLESDELHFDVGDYDYKSSQAFCVFIMYPTFSVWYKRKNNQATFFSDNQLLNQILQRFNGGPSQIHHTIRAVLHQISQSPNSPIPQPVENQTYQWEERSPEILSGRFWGIQGKLYVSFWQSKSDVKSHWDRVERLIHNVGFDPKKSQYLFGGTTTEDALNSYEEVVKGLNISQPIKPEDELRKKIHVNPRLKKALLKLPPDKLQVYADRMHVPIAKLKWMTNIDEVQGNIPIVNNNG